MELKDVLLVVSAGALYAWLVVQTWRSERSEPARREVPRPVPFVRAERGTRSRRFARIGDGDAVRSGR